MVSLALFCIVSLVASSCNRLSAAETATAHSDEHEDPSRGPDSHGPAESTPAGGEPAPSTAIPTGDAPPPPEGAPGAARPTDNHEEPWRSPDNPMTMVRFINGRHYENQYAHLSYILERALPNNEDVDANLAKAREWLDLERSGEAGFGSRGTIEALEQFLELDKLNEVETRCSFRAYKILWKNNKATHGRSHQEPSKFRPLTRIDRLVHQAARRHSLACLSVYPKLFRELSAQLERDHGAAITRLREYLDQVLDCTDCVVSRVRSLRSDRATQKAYELIERSLPPDSTGSPSLDERRKWLVNWLVDRSRRRIIASRVRALAQEYIIEPCRNFVRVLGANVYIPVPFFLQVLKPSERYNRAEDQNRDFFHGRLQYRLCESLLRYGQEALVFSLVSRYQQELRELSSESVVV